MRGLDPRTHESRYVTQMGFDRRHCALAASKLYLHSRFTMKGGWVYIMTNKPNSTLYVGVTSNLARRTWEHREGLTDGHTKRYGLKRLVYAERHEEIAQAIQREKTIKHWPRAWKVVLILKSNPEWDDLYESLL